MSKLKTVAGETMARVKSSMRVDTGLWGTLIFYKACNSQQTETDRATAFEHLPGCGYAGQRSTPWDDLDIIFQSFKHDK